MTLQACLSGPKQSVKTRPKTFSLPSSNPSATNVKTAGYRPRHPLKHDPLKHDRRAPTAIPIGIPEAAPADLTIPSKRQPIRHVPMLHDRLEATADHQAAPLAVLLRAAHVLAAAEENENEIPTAAAWTSKHVDILPPRAE